MSELKRWPESTEPKSQELDAFEMELMRAMRRVDAPEGFAVSVMERAAAPAAVTMAKVLVMPKRRIWWSGAGLAVAASLIVGVFFADQAHVRHERERAADQQFEAATRITDHALEQAREQLRRAGVSLE